MAWTGRQFALETTRCHSASSRGADTNQGKARPILSNQQIEKPPKR